MAYNPTVERGQKISYSAGAGQLLDADALTEERYDTSGAVTTVSPARGGVLTYTYSDAGTPPAIAPATGLLIQVSDPFGRNVKFSYEQPADINLSPRVLSIPLGPDEGLAAVETARGMQRRG